MHRLNQNLIPCETTSFEEMLRARHEDLNDLSATDAWAELILLRSHLARLILYRPRRLRIVRRDDDLLVSEQQWTSERIERLERLLAKRGRAA